jgi:hypothetical protein
VTSPSAPPPATPSRVPHPTGAPAALGGPGPQGYPPAQVPGGELVLELRKPSGGAMMMSPLITIDGFPARAQWGRNAYPAPAGRRHVRISTHYLWEYGTAEADVDVLPGRSSELHYSGPLITFMGGSIGQGRQPRRGQVVFWILMGVVLLMLLLVVAGLVLDR